MKNIDVVVKGANSIEFKYQLKESLLHSKLIKEAIANVNGGENIALTVDATPFIEVGEGLQGLIIQKILAFVESRHKGNIIILAESGIKITIPDSTPKEDLDYYLEKINKLGSIKSVEIQTNLLKC